MEKGLIDIEELKQLAARATPGPWEWWTSNSVLRLTGADGKDGGVLGSYAYGHQHDIRCNQDDQAYIAAANPAAVLELITEIEGQKIECATLRHGLRLSNENIVRLQAEIDKLQQICAAAYQMAGSAGAPVRFLDALSGPCEATQEQIDALLPVRMDEFDRVQ